MATGTRTHNDVVWRRVKLLVLLLLMMVMTMVAACCHAAHRGGITLNHRVTVVTGNAATATATTATQIYCVGMIVTVSAA